MKLRYKCDVCENGYRREYGHVSEGVCFKCSGTGNLPYNPRLIGGKELAEDDHEVYLRQKREDELIEQAERETFRYIVNGFRYDEDLTPEDFGYHSDAQ